MVNLKGNEFLYINFRPPFYGYVIYFLVQVFGGGERLALKINKEISLLALK